MDGEKFIRELRAKNIMIPVLFMSSKEYVDKYKTLNKELGLSGIVINLSPRRVGGAISVVTMSKPYKYAIWLLMMTQSAGVNPNLLYFAK